MQKPRLTDRTAEALEMSLPSFRLTIDGEDDLKLTQAKLFAIRYLEDLLRWKRQKENRK